MKIAKWGNSLAIRLPAIVVEAMGLKEGDEVTVRAAGDADVMVEKAETTAEWLDRMRKYRGRLPADFKFDREEANRRGE
jgi:antitoxin MazE